MVLTLAGAGVVMWQLPGLFQSIVTLAVPHDAQRGIKALPSQVRIFQEVDRQEFHAADHDADSHEGASVVSVTSSIHIHDHRHWTDQALERPQNASSPSCVLPLTHSSVARGPQVLNSWYIIFFQLPVLPELWLRAGGRCVEA